MPIQAGPRDTGLSDDLGTGVPGGAQVGGVVELGPGSPVTGRPTRRPLAVATARAWAARSRV